MLFVSLLLATNAAVSFSAVATLKGYNVNPDDVTVSGLSAGGFFAVQMHVAYSSTIKGAGVVAGGPYYCAQGSMTTALTACMSSPSLISYNSLVSTTDSWSNSGTIDKTSNLAGSKVYLLSGSKDTTVVPGVMDKLNDYYKNYKADVTYKKDLAVGHAFVTDNYGNGCSTSNSPWINNCAFDGAGTILQKLYGLLAPKTTTAQLAGQFIEFDQSPYFVGGKANGLNKSGWMYVPSACSSGAQQCRLHVVLHGCKQGTLDVGDVVVRKTGYNEWAETNSIIIVYPQTGTGSTNGCFDWWGDNDKTNYAKKSGNQMQVIKAIIDKVMSGSSTSGGDSNTTPSGGATATTKQQTTPSGQVYNRCFTANNYAHVTEARAYQKLGLVYANGSNQAMGLYNIFDVTKLRQTGANYYVIDTTC